MNKSFKYALIVTACNTGVLMLVLWTKDAGLLFILAMALIVELIVAIIFLASAANTQLGSGLLMAVGISLLVGLSVCSYISVG